MGKDKAKEHVTLQVCAGDKCTENKGKKLRKRLKELVAEQGLDDTVCVKKTGCMGKCGSGPNIRVDPAGTMIAEAKPKNAEAILKDALKSVGKK